MDKEWGRHAVKDYRPDSYPADCSTSNLCFTWESNANLITLHTNKFIICVFSGILVDIRVVCMLDLEGGGWVLFEKE